MQSHNYLYTPSHIIRVFTKCTSGELDHTGSQPFNRVENLSEFKGVKQLSEIHINQVKNSM